MAIHVLEYLEDACKRYPGKNALIDLEGALTYREVEQRAKAIGSTIRKQFRQVRRPVMVFSDRDSKSLVSFLGTAYSGNFYVPVDVHMPKARIETFFDTLSPEILICKEKDLPLAQETGKNCRIIVYEEAIKE